MPCAISGSVLFVLNLRIDVVFILLKQTIQLPSPEASSAQFQRSGAKSVIGKKIGTLYYYCYYENVKDGAGRLATEVISAFREFSKRGSIPHRRLEF